MVVAWFRELLLSNYYRVVVLSLFSVLGTHSHRRRVLLLLLVGSLVVTCLRRYFLAGLLVDTHVHTRAARAYSLDTAVRALSRQVAMSDAAAPVGLDGEEEEEEVVIVKDPVELMAELIVAAKTNDIEMAQSVLANDNLVATRELDAKGRLKWCPLTWAVNKGHQKLATLLLEHGFAEPFQTAVSERTKFLEDERDSQNILGVSTPLHWAALKGHLIILIELIEIYQFSVSGRDERGNTPLHLAAAGAPRGDQSAPQFLKVIEILLSEGADVHAKNYYGNTALDLASHNGVRLLVKTVMMARQTIDTTADDALEDEMAGLDLLSISRMREDQQQLTSLTDKVGWWQSTN